MQSVRSPGLELQVCVLLVAVLTWVQFLAFGSSSSTLVICLRKSDSCMPGLAPLLLNRARGLARITCRFTAKPSHGEWEEFVSHISIAVLVDKSVQWILSYQRQTCYTLNTSMCSTMHQTTSQPFTNELSGMIFWCISHLKRRLYSPRHIYILHVTVTLKLTLQRGNMALSCVLFYPGYRLFSRMLAL